MTHYPDQFSSPDDLPVEAVQRCVQAGLPLATGLRAYAEECPARSAVALRQLAASVEAGTPLSRAVEQPGLSLPPYLAGLIEGGLRSNTLGVMLEYYLQQRRRLRRLGQQAALDIIYPLLVLLITAVVGTSILVWLVPMFKVLFDDFAVELPALTQLVFHLSSLALFLKWPLIFALAGVAIVLLVILIGGRWITVLLDRIPFIGQTARYATMSEFCYLLSPLVESGVPIQKSLLAISSVMEPSRVRSDTLRLARLFDGSESLADMADERDLLPAELVHLLRWENRGSAFGEILKSWAEMFGRMASGHSAKVTAILTPFLMLGVGFLVGLLVIALFMPLVKLLNELS